MLQHKADRCYQALLLFSMAWLSWLLMMVTHEAGHVLHGWMSGAGLDCVLLPPFGFSRTDFMTNPHPLFVAWGGAIWGCLIPLSLLAIISAFARRYAYLARWFAGFCLIANGAYLAAGALRGGDADDGAVLLHSGAAVWQLLAFGIPTVAAGLFLWNGLGQSFGLGPARGKVDRKVAVILPVALAVVVAVELAAGGG